MLDSWLSNRHHDVTADEAAPEEICVYLVECAVHSAHHKDASKAHAAVFPPGFVSTQLSNVPHVSAVHREEANRGDEVLQVNKRATSRMKNGDDSIM